ncbi:lariat debranching enzyme [Dipsacomyces acuminosporus]|nr:lariat debranching enzyme [Dipsacomyces acuminosporus]
MARKLNIAVEGCCHGMLDDIYQQLEYKQRQMGKRVDLLIICGDFQAIRNVTDLECMSCPDKYKQIGGFYRYYTGERTAPIPTIFVGGNHEASNHMRELYYGGWVAPNIYYMGSAGVIKFGGLRIGGISGIFKDFSFAKGYYERPPFRKNSPLSSMHHVRSYEVFKMLQIRQPLDIVVSHDWPQYIERYGDTQDLLNRKPFFKSEVDRGDLGSPANALLLERLRPAWWLSAHLHVRFEAQLSPHDTIFSEGWAGISPYGSAQPADSRQHASANAGAGVVSGAVENEDEIVIADFSDDESSERPDLPSAKRRAELESLKGSADAAQSNESCQPKRTRLALSLPPPRGAVGSNTNTLNDSASDNSKPAALEQQEGAVTEPSSGIELDTSVSTPKPATPPPAAANTDSGALNGRESLSAEPQEPSRPTRFLALDKCLPRRQYLEIIEIEAPHCTGSETLQLEYDPEWLAILRVCNPFMPLDGSPFHPPAQASLTADHLGIPLFPKELLDRELDWVYKNVFANGRVFVPPNFMQMAPAPPQGTPDSASFGLASRRFGGGDRGFRGGRGARGGRGGRGRGGYGYGQQRSDPPWPGPRPYVIYPNPQTDELCQMLALEDKLTQCQQ